MSKFEVKFSPVRPKSVDKDPKMDDDSILTLAPFTPHPKICFDNAIVGCPLIRRLIIKNPQPRDIHLYLTKIPPLQRCVSFNWVEKVIPAHNQEVLEIMWCPQKEGGWHDVFILDDKCRMKREVSMTFKSVQKTANKVIRGAKKKTTYVAKRRKSPKLIKHKDTTSKERKRWSNPKTPNILTTENIRRETFSLGNKENFEPFHLHPPQNLYREMGKRRSVWENSSEFNDSLELDSPLKEKSNVLKPLNLSPNISSAGKKNDTTFDLKGHNISSETYVKGNLSGSTYVINNEQSSFGTYVKDNSVGNLATLEECVSPSNFPLTRDTVDTVIKANLWSNGKSPPKCSRKRTYDRAIAEMKTDTFLRPNPHNFSTDTYVLGNLSSETYVKDISHQNVSLAGESFRTSPKIIVTSDSPPVLSHADKTLCQQPTSCHRKLNFSKTLNLNQVLRNTRRRTEISTHHPDNFINNSEVITYTHNVDPFMSATLFYDPKWVDEQEVRFARWLNMLLTPPDELSANCNAPLLDVAKVWQQCKNRDVEKAPTKEEISNKFNSNALNNLRNNAKKFLNKPEITQVLLKVVRMIESERLTIRKDKNVHLDVGLQHEIMGLFLCYNPLWLRIGFETIFGVRINLISNTDISGLIAFAMKNFFKDSYLMKKHKTIHTGKYEADIKKHILKKFFTFVYFVDKAKVNRLIPYDPCLFCKKSPIKESREIIQRFSSAVIHAGGDINRCLSFVGYSLEHKQEFIHEFVYAVEVLGSDLRDGVRLTRVMEIILLRNDLTKKLRVPPNSRLQKIHNMKIVFESLSEANFIIIHDIQPKDIVDGHKEKTLSFLWQLIYKFQGPRFTKLVTVVQKWWRSLQIVIKRRILTKKHIERVAAANKIKAWFKKRMFLRKCEIFKTAYNHFLRNKAATKIQSCVRMFLQRRRFRQFRYLIISSAITIQSCVRGYLARKRFKKLKQAVSVLELRYEARRKMQEQLLIYRKTKGAVLYIEDKYKANKLMRQERDEYLVLKSKTIKIQRWFRKVKLEQSSNKIDNAARIIQTHFRGYLEMKKTRCEFISLQKSALIIQNRFRANKMMAQTRDAFLTKKNAIVKIQAYLKGYLAMKKARLEYVTMHKATLVIQTRFRANILMRQTRHDFVDKKNAATKIQAFFRGYLAMQKVRLEYVTLHNATLLIQTKFRANILMRQAKNDYDTKKNAANNIQTFFRSYLAMKKARLEYITLHKATLLIQTKYRANMLMRRAKKDFDNKKNAAIKIQTIFRSYLAMKKARLEYITLHKATLLIQTKYRANILMRQAKKDFDNKKNAANKIQTFFRSYLAMKKARLEYVTLQKAILLIQTKFRANILMRQVKKDYDIKKNAANKIQTFFRSYLAMKKARLEYVTLQKATLLIQTKFRANILMRKAKKDYDTKKNAANKIQTFFRSYLAMKKARLEYVTLHKATLLIQTKFRANILMRQVKKDYDTKKNAAIKIQLFFRGYLAMKKAKLEYVTLHKATLLIQTKFRANILMRQAKKDFDNKKNAAIKIQTFFRAYLAMKKARLDYVTLHNATLFIQTKFRANILMRQAKNDFYNKKNAAIKIQTFFRGYLAMKKARLEYVTQHNATLLIQTKFRANILMRQAKKDFDNKKNAAVKIQTYFRMYLVMKKNRLKYFALRKAVLVIQRRFRAKLLIRQARSEFLAKMNAVIKIQRHYRLYVFEKNNKRIEELNEIRCKQENAARVIQIYFRGYLLMKQLKLDYKKKSSAAITIQKHFRIYSERVKAKNQAMENRAAVSIQRRFRSYLKMKAHRQLFVTKKDAACKIQMWFRSIRCMQTEKKNYKVIRQSVIYIQRFYRRYAVRKGEMVKKTTKFVIKIQAYARGFLGRAKYKAMLKNSNELKRRREAFARKHSATKIQAAWRGFNARKSSTKRLSEIRRRCQDAQKNANPKSTMAFLKVEAVSLLLGSKDINLMEYVRALKHLDYIARRFKQDLTTFSPVFSRIIMNFLLLPGRSFIDMEATKYAASIMISLLKYPPSAKFAWFPDDMEHLLTQMVIFSDKENVVFPYICTMFWLYCNNEEQLNYIKSIPTLVIQMRKIKALCDRKQKMVLKGSYKGLHSVFAFYDDLPLPWLQPDWGLDFIEKPRTFTNSIHAYKAIFAILGLE